MPHEDLNRRDRHRWVTRSFVRDTTGQTNRANTTGQANEAVSPANPSTTAPRGAELTACAKSNGPRTECATIRSETFSRSKGVRPERKAR
jgi:hypothetical protein